MALATRKSLCIFNSLNVKICELSKFRIKANYEILTHSGESSSIELIYSYSESLFEKSYAEISNLASVILAQVAINYGLFCKEINFFGTYDSIDQRLILDTLENTAREIYVNKFLKKTEFLLPPYDQMPIEPSDKFLNARVNFFPIPKNLSNYDTPLIPWKPLDTNVAILSSGGKDSLLSYGIMKELNFNTHPIFINESGRHWLTAKNSFQELSLSNPLTSKVWCNCDRVYNWFLRKMPFIRTDYATVKSDIYPIRLWTVAVFLFGILPLVRKRNIKHILIGNEYDCTQSLNFHGITHYNSLYDQSKYFDNKLTRFFHKKKWFLFQYSILRSLSELGIMEILTKRYPELQCQQVSCHSAHIEKGIVKPCGKCEKCRRIVGMILAINQQPYACGYTEVQVKNCLFDLEHFKTKQIGPDASHLYYLLTESKIINSNTFVKSVAKRHDYVMKMRFDSDRSTLSDIPISIRKQLISIFSSHLTGAVKRKNKQWVPIDIQSSEEINSPYFLDIKTPYK